MGLGFAGVRDPAAASPIQSLAPTPSFPEWASCGGGRVAAEAGGRCVERYNGARVVVLCGFGPRGRAFLGLNGIGKKGCRPGGFRTPSSLQPRYERKNRRIRTGL